MHHPLIGWQAVESCTKGRRNSWQRAGKQHKVLPWTATISLCLTGNVGGHVSARRKSPFPLQII